MCHLLRGQDGMAQSAQHRDNIVVIALQPCCESHTPEEQYLTLTCSCRKQLVLVAFTHDSQAEAETGQQSAALAAQRILEWPRLCSHVAAFASTTLGRKAVLELQVSAHWQIMHRRRMERPSDVVFGGMHAATCFICPICPQMAYAHVNSVES